MFATYSIPDALVSDNRATFTGRELNIFYATLPLEVKRAGRKICLYFQASVKKARNDTGNDEGLKYFFGVYKVKPNSVTSSEKFPASLMFIRIIRAIIDKLLSNHFQVRDEFKFLKFTKMDKKVGWVV